MRFTRFWLIARWVLAVVGLAVAGYMLVASWGAFHEFGFNRSLGYPMVVSRTEIAFWYAFRGFQAGLLIGLLPALTGRGLGHQLLVLNLAAWAELAVNAGIVIWLVRTGALF